MFSLRKIPSKEPKIAPNRKYTSTLIFDRNKNQRRIFKQKGFFTDVQNQRQWFEDSGKKLGVKNVDDWYKITMAKIRSLPGSSFINHYYKNSVYTALVASFPEVEWKPWLFANMPQKYWEDTQNQHKYVTWLGRQLKINSMDDWYKVTNTTVLQHHGGGLLRCYEHSFVKAITKLFPRHNWEIWKFKSVPKGYWDSQQNVTDYLKHLATSLQITDAQEWNDISYKTLVARKGSVILSNSGGLKSMIAKYFPEYSTENYRRHPSKSQLILLKTVEKLFQPAQVLLGYRNPELGSTFYLSVYIPQYKLAFQYNGAHHYKWHAIYGSQEAYQQIERLRSQICKDNGITLITVPFWWDEKASSLEATIHQQRPDLIPHCNGTAIPETEPSRRTTSRTHLDYVPLGYALKLNLER